MSRPWSGPWMIRFLVWLGLAEVHRVSRIVPQDPLGQLLLAPLLLICAQLSWVLATGGQTR